MTGITTASQSSGSSRNWTTMEFSEEGVDYLLLAVLIVYYETRITSDTISGLIKRQVSRLDVNAHR